MKRITTVLLAFLVLSCANNSKDFYTFKVELLDGSIDTIKVERRYNKELRLQEGRVINSEYFNKTGLETAYGFASMHPLADLYPEDLEALKNELIKFSEISKSVDRPLDERLVNNTIVFNRNLEVPLHKGKIKSFTVLKITDSLGVSIAIPQSKLFQFLNHPSVTVEELDNIAYVRNSAAVKIIELRPILTIEELDAIAFIGNTSISRLKAYAQTWVNPDN